MAVCSIACSTDNASIGHSKPDSALNSFEKSLKGQDTTQSQKESIFKMLVEVTGIYIDGTLDSGRVAQLAGRLMSSTHSGTTILHVISSFSQITSKDGESIAPP